MNFMLKMKIEFPLRRQEDVDKLINRHQSAVVVTRLAIKEKLMELQIAKEVKRRWQVVKNRGGSPRPAKSARPRPA